MADGFLAVVLCAAALQSVQSSPCDVMNPTCSLTFWGLISALCRAGHSHALLGAGDQPTGLSHLYFLQSDRPLCILSGRILNCSSLTYPSDEEVIVMLRSFPFMSHGLMWIQTVQILIKSTFSFTVGTLGCLSTSIPHSFHYNQLSLSLMHYVACINLHAGSFCILSWLSNLIPMDIGRYKAMGRKGKETQGVACTVEPKINPIKHPLMEKASSSKCSVCTLQVILQI